MAKKVIFRQVQDIVFRENYPNKLSKTLVNVLNM